jgi:hypothetical protein
MRTPLFVLFELELPVELEFSNKKAVRTDSWSLLYTHPDIALYHPSRRNYGYPLLGRHEWLIYLAGAMLLGLGFLYFAIQMLRLTDDKQLPMKTFGYSINYLMVLFIVLLVDHYFLFRLT